jgi:bifunctional UDP-N-acetylglucosamine pyrophosphorylase/glucosamine-1-phosphate N-acetyltransferase
MDAIAVLLAAGAGRKFWPYNEVRNKCAFPIANEPLVLRLARQCRELGFRRIVVVVGPHEGSVRAALEPLGEDEIRFVRQPSGCAGTAHAVLAAIPSEERASVLVAYADTWVSTDDIRATWQAVTDGAEAAALLAPLGGIDPGSWITAGLKSEESGRTLLSGLEGHGRDGSHRLAGIFALTPAVWPALRAHPGHVTHVPVGGMPAMEADLSETLATLADRGRCVAGVVAAKPTVDLDKPWHILEAAEAALREKGEQLEQTGSVIADGAKISDGADIEGPICCEAGAVIGKRVVLSGLNWIGSNSRVINGAIVGRHSMIGRDCRISDYCQVGSAVIGDECVVGHGGEFEGVMLNRAYIYHYSEIYGVLGTCVDIGAATVCGTLRFDDGETVHRVLGKREAPRTGSNATYIGDYSRTGVNVITQPGVKIGCNTCIGAGVVVYEDVPSRKLILLKQETVQRDWGPERYGW